MSLAAGERKNAWQEHRDSLTRIRTQLSDKQSPIPRSPNNASPARSPAAGRGRRSSHSPYGKYRQSTPPYLPRLETPPDEKRKQSNLRGNRYGVVPPVRDARRREGARSTDYDSWGEDSDESDDDEPGQFMPQPYPYPVQQYQYPQPQVVWGAPFPVYYPPPPPKQSQKRRTRKENDYSPRRRKSEPTFGQPRMPLAERYEDVNVSVPTRPARKKQAKVTFDHPPPAVNGYYGYPMYTYPTQQEPKRKRNEDSRYKYIHPRDTPYSPEDLYGQNVYARFKDEPARLMSYYLKDHPLFAEEFVEWLISQSLDEIVPDILYDTLEEIGKSVGLSENPFDQLRDGIVAETIPEMLHDIVKTTLNEMVDDIDGKKIAEYGYCVCLFNPFNSADLKRGAMRPVWTQIRQYMLNQEPTADPLESFLDRLLNDAVREASGDIVKETVKEMAQEYVAVKHHEVAYDDLFRDYMDEIGPEVIEDALTDIIAEDFIRDQVIEMELEEEVPVIAKEVLSHYDTKVMRRELKEVSSQAGDKLLESVLTDYLMSLLARQGKVWTESDHANKYMDDIVSNLLLEKLFDVTVQRRKTVVSKPLRKLHEKVVTDVALDVMIQQLTASLDEDLLDVDEYERGEVDSSRNTPIRFR